MGNRSLHGAAFKHVNRREGTNAVNLDRKGRNTWRSAPGGGEGYQRSNCRLRERPHGAHRLKNHSQRGGCRQNGQRSVAQNMASAMAIVAETALRLFHCLPDSVEVVARGNHGKQHHERAAERTDYNKRGTRPRRGRDPAPPQQVCGQQQSKPTKIEQELHKQRLTPPTTGPDDLPARLLQASSQR